MYTLFRLFCPSIDFRRILLRSPVIAALASLSLIGITTLSVRFAYSAPPSKSFKSIPSGYSSENILVKFREGTVVDQPEILLSQELLDSVKRITPLFTLPKNKLKDLKDRGEQLSKQKMPNLSLWFTITLKHGVDAVDFMEKLKLLNSVELVEPAPLPAPPPAITPNLTPDQDYLNPATDGIDAFYSWTVPGGNGSSIKIYDVEYSWNQTHEDLIKVRGLALLMNPGDSLDDPFNDNNHGTAVLGELIADNDSKGVTGISWGADIGLAPANTTNLGYNPANAILLSVADGSPGDVILIEQQTCVCDLVCNETTQDGYGPLEWDSSVFDAILTAVAHGFVVVEAAGNGNVDLDQAACDPYFNRNMWDSGAIIVGAGQFPFGGYDRERESFSTYGSRVDVQGWGGHVATSGYGDFYKNPDDLTNPDFWYTFFSGTSSASPMVAGAGTDLQGIAATYLGAPLTPSQIRQLLVNTGSPQLGNTNKNIGPRPDLRQAIAQLTTPPTGSIIINAGAATTNTTSVTLTLSCVDSGSGCAQMRFSNDNSTWSAWESYNTSKAWTLTSGDGTKTVYVQFKDGLGLLSYPYSDTIILQTTSPYVNCNIVPDATEIPRGGTLRFQGTITNNTNKSGTVLFATDVTLPNLNRYPASGYLIEPFEVYLNPYQSKSGYRSHTIPLGAQLGIYTYHGYVGRYGVGKLCECTFEFEVVEQQP
jgi:serine protease